MISMDLVMSMNQTRPQAFAATAAYEYDRVGSMPQVAEASSTYYNYATHDSKVASTYTNSTTTKLTIPIHHPLLLH